MSAPSDRPSRLGSSHKMSTSCSGDISQAFWMYDCRDHELVGMVNAFIASTEHGDRKYLLDSDLHPHGIIAMTTDQRTRVARSVIVLLESFKSGEPKQRLHALRRLHDEVLYSATSRLHNNTGRVLVEAMKALVC